MGNTDEMGTMKNATTAGKAQSTSTNDEQAPRLVISPREWVQLCHSFGNGCALCGNTEGLVPDLVIPANLGGTSDINNIQPLCMQCSSTKAGYLVDYRPFEPLVGEAVQYEGEREMAVSKRPHIPRMLTRKHLMAIEHSFMPPQNNIVEDPIVQYDIAPLLIEELRRLRAIIVANPRLARIESQAWRERYASLSPSAKNRNPKKLAG